MSNEAEKCWLIQSGSEPAGPYSFAQLRSLARNGRIARNTLIRDLRSSGWFVAGQLPELFLQTLPAVKGADQAKPHQQKLTPPRPVISITDTIPNRGSMLPSVASGLNQQITSAANWHAIIVAGIAGAVGSAVLIMILIASFQRSAVEQPEPSADIAVTATAPAAVANVDSTTTTPLGQSAVFSTEDLVSRTQQSVAAVITNNGSGSGFMVGRNVLATNYHVIADSPSNEIAIVFPDGQDSKQGPFQASIIAERPDRDLALLRIKADIPPLEVHRSYQFRRGQDIVIIGTPGYARQGLLPNAVTRGVLSSQANLYGFEHFQLSLAVNSGNSGGPVLGMDGRVIGVVVSKSLTEESIGFCIPATDLESLIRSAESCEAADTADVAALHDARLVVRAVVDQIFERKDFMIAYISHVGEPQPTASASRFIQEMKQLPSDDLPELFKSYERDLSTVARDPLLANDVREAISGVHRRHIAIDRILRSPTGSIERFVAQLSSLENDLFSYLSNVGDTLQIGRPELLTQ